MHFCRAQLWQSGGVGKCWFPWTAKRVKL